MLVSATESTYMLVNVLVIGSESEWVLASVSECKWVLVSVNYD